MAADPVIYRIVRDFNKTPNSGTSVLMPRRYQDKSAALEDAFGMNKTEVNPLVAYRVIPERM